MDSAVVSPGRSPMKFYTSQQLIDKTDQDNALEEEKYRRACIRNMTLKQSIEEVGGTLQGVFEDVFHNTDPKSFNEVFVSSNRLRGFGLILVAMALSGIIIDAVLD
jgi:hypothetical protein